MNRDLFSIAERTQVSGRHFDSSHNNRHLKNNVCRCLPIIAPNASQVIDKGLGSVSLNAVKLFARLTTATNVTDSISSVSNLNTAVNILDSMQQLNTYFDESTLDVSRNSHY